MNSHFASNLIKYFELLAAVIGLFCYGGKFRSVWFKFSLYLLVLFCMECAGEWFGIKGMYAANTRLYKWLVIPSLFLMYHLVFYQILTARRLWVITGGCLFFLTALLENIFLVKEHFYSISTALTVGCVVILLYFFLYVSALLKSPDLLFFYRRMDFWFCLGVGTFYTCCFPYLTFFNSLGYNHGSLIAAYRWVFILLNYFMYLSFCVGFIWSKQRS